MALDTYPIVDQEELEELRWSLQCFEEDWIDPRMDVYDES